MHCDFTGKARRKASHFFGFFTEFRENEDARFGVAGQKSRQRLECVCLQHRFPFAATRQASSHGSLCPEAKASVKPDALQTLARAAYHQTRPSSSVRPGIP